MKNCIAELKLSGSQFAPKAQLHKISRAKNQLVSAEQFAESASGYFETTTAQIYKLYHTRLRGCDAGSVPGDPDVLDLACELGCAALRTPPTNLSWIPAALMAAL